MNAGASTSAVPSPIEGSGTAWVLLGSWALSPARPTPIHPRPERRGFSALLVMARRVGRGERPLRDERTGTPTQYLFMEHGKLLSDHYLFAAPLRAVCQRIGLVDAQGRPTITPHRFRHTVGTQLAERGAKLHTIMQ